MTKAQTQSPAALGAATVPDPDPADGPEAASVLDDPGGVLVSTAFKEASLKLEIRYNVTAGLDVHKDQTTVCVQFPDRQEIRVFRNVKAENRKMARWLKACGVEAALMESTGVYWKSLHDILRNHDVAVLVVNARHIKRFEGHKTDKMDAERLATLAKLGVIRGSRILPKDVDELRSLARQRQSMVEDMADWRNRTLKALTDSGFGVSQAVTDAFGATGRIIIDGLLEGKAIEEIMAEIEESVGFRRLKTPAAMIIDSLEGTLSECAKIQVRNALMVADTLEELAAETESRIKAALEGMGLGVELMLLQTLPGVSEVAAMTLLLELGCDLSAFRDPSRLASWAGVCPGNNESAGKRASGRTTGGNPYVKRILCEIANAAVRSKCYFKEKFHSLRARRGYKRAIVAIGHKILKIVHRMLTRHQPYEDRLEAYLLEKTARNLPRWRKAIMAYNKAMAAAR
jgi:transposase